MHTGDWRHQEEGRSDAHRWLAGREGTLDQHKGALPAWLRLQPGRAAQSRSAPSQGPPSALCGWEGRQGRGRHGKRPL